jgi:hypothetical protein
VYQLGLFAVIGAPSNDVGSTYAYPVPFVFGKDTDIKFKNLPDYGNIKIYTVTGELVRDIQFNTGRTDPLSWDVTNAGGEKLGADVYLYIVESAGNKKKGKIVVVR